MRGFASIVALGLFFLTVGCSALQEERLIEQGIGTELAAEDIAESTNRLSNYLMFLCGQAGLATTTVVEGGENQISCNTSGRAGWSTVVRAGFNDIDRRCDSYLAWLNSRRRNQNAILSQIHDTRTFTEALLFTAGVSATPLTIAGLAFGLASNTFTNYYSRLLFEIEKSTVGVVVHEKRLEYRTKFDIQITNQPDAVHVLREYLLICTPFFIEDVINQRTRDSVAGNTPADKGNSDQIRRSLVAGALLSSIPPGGPRGPLPQGGGAAGEPKMTEPNTPTEGQLSKAIGQTLQANLCANPNGKFDAATREAIRQAKIAANATRAPKKMAPLFQKPVNGEIRTAGEAQIFLDARSCSKDFSGTDRGYMTAFEKFRFVDENSIKDLQTALKKCDQKVALTGVFDDATRGGISAAMVKAGLPESKTLNDKSYEQVSAVCI
jgi:hypothetical protein